MKSVQSIKEDYLKRIRSEQQALVARLGDVSEISHPLLVARLQQLRKLKSIHQKSDDLNFNAQMIKAFNYLCEHNILFFLTVTRQFDVLRKLLHAKTDRAKMCTLRRKIKRKRGRAVAKRHPFPRPVILFPEMEEHPGAHSTASQVSVAEATSNVPIRYRFFMSSAKEAGAALIRLDEINPRTSRVIPNEVRDDATLG